MKDTRALQMLGLAEDMVTLAAELLAEGITDHQDMLHVACIEKLGADIVKRATALYTPEPCKSRFGFSAHCDLNAGHTGKHRHYTIQWTDAESATSTASIAKQTGRND